MVRQREQAIQELRSMAVGLGYLAHDRPRERAVRAREIEVHLNLGVGVVMLGAGLTAGFFDQQLCCGYSKRVYIERHEKCAGPRGDTKDGT